MSILTLYIHTDLSPADSDDFMIVQDRLQIIAARHGSSTRIVGVVGGRDPLEAAREAHAAQVHALMRDIAALEVENAALREKVDRVADLDKTGQRSTRKT